MKKNKNYLPLALIVIAAILQCRHLFSPGFYTFSDEPHIANLHQMVQALKSGQIAPRWGPNFSFDFGHPFFNFYYLLPFLAGSLLNIFLHINLIWSLKLVFIISSILSGIFFYFLAKKLFSIPIALSTALLYLFTPYRAVDLYVRGAVGEITAFALLPLVCLGTINLIQKPNPKNFFKSSLYLFLLLIAHNLSFLIFVPFLTIIIFCYQKKSLKHFFLSLTISLTFASFHLLPAILEKQFMQAGTPFNPLDHFPFIKQLILPSWGYGASLWGPHDGLSFQIGIINLVAILLSVLTIKKQTLPHRKILSGLLICFFSATFMMNIRSWFIWQIIPISDYIQFPWRFLIITTFISSFSLGFTAKINKLLPPFLAACAIILTLSYFQPAKTLSVDDDYFLKRFFANQNSQGTTKQTSSQYSNYSEDYLPLTVWTQSRPDHLPPKIEDNPHVYITSANLDNPINLKINFTADQSTILKINNYYFPGWQAKIDNRKANISPIDSVGRTGINIPQGKHSLILSFKNTPIRTIANLISLVSFTGFFLYALKTKK